MTQKNLRKLFQLIIVSIFVQAKCYSQNKIYHPNWIDFNKNGLKDIYEDPNRSLEDRVNDLLSQMTLEEKRTKPPPYMAMAEF